MTKRLAIWLPASLWLSYSVWNGILATPPSVGPLSAINVQYLLMLPAAVWLAARGLAGRLPGQWAYVAFVGWVVFGLLWYDPASGVEPAKAVLVYGLLGLTAAQVVAGGARTQQLLTGSLLLTAAVFAVWTIGYALETRFAYRAGVPVNPNFVAVLVGLGLVAATALYFTGTRGRGWLLSLILVTWYASLLLGSRGGLLALLAAVGVLALLARPGWRAWPLVAGAALVVVLAQLPVVPDTLWGTAQAQSDRISRWLTQAEEPPAVVEAANSPPSGVPSGGVAEPAPAVPTPATPAPPPPPPKEVAPRLESDSTAIARFTEGQVGSFNLRGALWRGALAHLTSSVRLLVVGGGLGTSGVVAHEANPVFRNMHNIVLQVTLDFGLFGLALLALVHWQVIRSHLARLDRDSHVLLGGLTFFLVAGLTASVIDLHLYWVWLGAAAGARHLTR